MKKESETTVVSPPSEPITESHSSPSISKNSATGQVVIEDIIPAYYHEQDGVPVFEPTFAQFQDFYGYIKKIEKYGRVAGLCKIVPPEEWILKNYTNSKGISDFKIKNPITQTFNCGGLPAGAQRQFNIETRKTYSLKDWHEISLSENYCPPILTDRGLALPNDTSKKRKRTEEDRTGEKSLGDIVEAVDKTSVNTASGNVSMEGESLHKQLPAFMKSDPTYETPEYLSALERFYWRNLSFQNTIYGADLLGSLVNIHT